MAKNRWKYLATYSHCFHLWCYHTYSHCFHVWCYRTKLPLQTIPTMYATVVLWYSLCLKVRWVWSREFEYRHYLLWDQLKKRSEMASKIVSFSLRPAITFSLKVDSAICHTLMKFSPKLVLGSKHYIASRTKSKRILF